MTETILIQTDNDGIATLTLNRPDKHHAMNARMIAELTEAAAQLGEDGNVRAVILASTGPSFCAGGDLEWMRAQQAADRAGKMAEAGRLSAMLAALNALPKPLIAKVQGNAYGGGIGLIAVSDIAIAAEGVKLALTETRLGLIPATIGPFVVARMGQGMARQIFFAGNPITQDFALRAGLLHQVCAADQLEGAVRRQADAVLKTAPAAVAAAKALCQRLGQDQAGDIAASITALADCWEGAEAQERIREFLSGGR
ncbi:enoyl-CoA hydratase-related protein [Paracoccus laeviglucosivorans]|uniref:Methylglutaconyl-CoA hydratase n=1 Tax=Paracoccus laeviglucosivorans TaxID=1197861 RepID=A0A521BBI7_9RHOB|nr:enoyl-CoA hydratase-related protein [Paracoccus laeviglucosivorans]SMO44443.1 methylglutaconyl-CoA hydratase [Paracoccus laeviglucosivorans]